MDPDLDEFLRDLVVPSLLRQRRRDRVEGASTIDVERVVADGRLDARALLGVGRVGSREVGAVQLALAAGPDRRLAAGSICDQEEEEPRIASMAAAAQD